jgi:hypothetical protein
MTGPEQSLIDSTLPFTPIAGKTEIGTVMKSKNIKIFIKLPIGKNL